MLVFVRIDRYSLFSTSKVVFIYIRVTNYINFNIYLTVIGVLLVL